MRFVSTGFHGVIDYLTAIALMASPWLFGFAGYDLWATAVPVTAGATLLVYSMFTSYELGLTRSGISMGVHLLFDAIIGLTLIASPWAFGFADEVFLHHVIIGGSELLFALITKLHPRSSTVYDPTIGHGNRTAGSNDNTAAGGMGAPSSEVPKGKGRAL